MPSTRLVEPSRIASTSRDSCRISRETFSGRSLESITPLDEAQVRRQQLLGVVHDEDALDVELDAVALVAVPQVERRSARDVTAPTSCDTTDPGAGRQVRRERRSTIGSWEYSMATSGLIDVSDGHVRVVFHSEASELSVAVRSPV